MTWGSYNVSRNVYDAAGQRLQARVGVGSPDEAAEATWTYSPNGLVQTLTDGNGNAGYFHYDGHDRLQYRVMPSATATGSWDWSNVEYYGYDAVGNRTLMVKRDGSVLTYQYDALNRLIVKIVPERPTGPQALTASQTRDVFYGYDLRNLQLYARFDSASGEGVTNSYDGFGRPASSSTNMGGTTRTLTYGYDAQGNRTQLFHPDGAWFTTVYDSRSRPYYLSNNGSVGLAFVSFNAAGLPAAMGHAGGTGYGYDAVQRPASLAHSFSGGAGSVVWTFGRNPAGQLSSVARDNDAFAWTGAYSVNRAYAVNGLNQYTAAGPTAFAYDANGNLISETTSNVTRTYTYDIENRLVGASVPGGSQVQLGYDPLGRLYQVSSSNGPTTRFLYDGDALVAEYDSADVMTRRYAHWVGADVPLVSYEGASLETATARWLFADHQGSIIAGAHPSGATASINTYDEYGIPGAGNTGRFQYTGQAWLAELGMYHYKARIYSPTLGRFLQTDPVGYEDQLNLYAYVGNDPVNRVDYSGRWSQEVHNLILGNVLRRRHRDYWVSWFTERMSLRQDTGPEANNLYAHFLRAPGEDRQQALAAFRRYVAGHIREARNAVRREDERTALVHFVKAAHAVQDSFSPVHNRDGFPAEYRDDPGSPALVDAMRQNHSPFDSMGGEGMDDATPRLRQAMTRATDAVANQIWGNPRVQCLGSRILRDHC